MDEMSNRLVSIIVVAAGKSGYLKACLDSLAAQGYPRVEVILIDNSLKEGFAQALNREFPFVKVFSSKENLFYCASLNKGIQMSKGDFIICLNDDAVLSENYIENAIKGFGVSDNIGMVSGKILRFDKKTLDSTGLYLSLWKTAKERGYGRQDGPGFDNEGFIFGVNGAAAFYRRKMLEDIRFQIFL
jgi:GT2 family glycosyltransferase